ncbi:uncharacterized protein LOC110651816 [Hevea brasiliensis]|nr:uncharacterized protein LOC110651816 [Hevea brasiliensis]
MFNKLKEFYFEKYNVLVAMERDIKGNGPDAFENPIALKPKLEEPKVVKKDINAAEMMEKKDTTSTKKVIPTKPDFAPTENKTCASLEIKEMTAESVSGRDLPDVPSSKNIQKEWTCPICQITTTSEIVFISHLQGRRHEAASEKLKANQMLQNKNSPASVERSAPKEMAATVVAGRDLPIKLPSENIEEWNCPICQVKTSSQTVFISHLQGMRHEAASKKLKSKNQILESNTSPASVETTASKEMPTAGVAVGDFPNKSPSKSIQKWNCPICQITTPSETIFISHLQGSQHEDASEKLKSKNQQLESDNCISSIEMNAPKEMATTTVSDGDLIDKPTSVNSKEWTCPICQVISISEALFISHLQGRRHKGALKKLKVQDMMLQSENSPASVENVAPKKMAATKVAGGDLPNNMPSEKAQKQWTCPICQVTTTSEKIFVSHLQGGRHQAASEKLKAKNQMLESKNSPTSMETGAPKEMATTTIAGSTFPDKLPSQNILKEWTCAICQVTTTNETDHSLHLQGRQHEDACERLKAKNQTSTSKVCPSSVETHVPTERREMANATVAGRDISDKSCLKKAQNEWTCAICLVTTTSEADLISHLQGQRHADAYEKLTAKDETSKSKISPASLETCSPLEKKEMTTAKIEDGDISNKPHSKLVQKPWTCSICQVIATSEAELTSHIQGHRHNECDEKLKTMKQLSNSLVFPASMETCAPLEKKEMGATKGADGGIPEKPQPKNSQKVWICALCHVTATSETDLISHCQGKRHRVACEKLIDQKQKSTSNVSPASPKSTSSKAKKQGKQENLKNRVVEVRNSLWWCTICNTSCNSEGNMDTHLSGNKHLSRIQELNSAGGSGQA